MFLFARLGQHVHVDGEELVGLEISDSALWNCDYALLPFVYFLLG